ncbi:MAG: isopentenyl-diphosphate delta-isomerase [Bacteroidetes bacterium]|jgi:isopentenyl-diphosphate delta-isomerase|nr:isopentenyl-diphosphate delta-isomerase [Bacteroidota bacterium]
MEQVILVNEQDKELGTMEKMQAHLEGKLHRAFSVFIFDTAGRLLLQKRALDKYHSAGLWTNTCCSHPRPGETTADAALRRLEEEMGMRCELKHIFSFVYKAGMENGLTEHEYDHIFFGSYSESPSINREEVSEWKYESLAAIAENMKAHPDQYTVWFKLVFERILEQRSNTH